MHKLCPRCGVIFEMNEQKKFCSERCEKLFQQSSLDVINGKSSRFPGKEGLISSLADRVKKEGSIDGAKVAEEFKHTDDGQTEIVRPVRK